MDAKYFTLKEVELNNNCPECYSKDGLQLTFKQRFIESSFYKAISKETSYSLFCDVCKTIISPARWTNDIELVFEYQQRASPPKPSSFKLKNPSWVIIGVLITLILIATLFILDVF